SVHLTLGGRACYVCATFVRSFVYADEACALIGAVYWRCSGRSASGHWLCGRHRDARWARTFVVLDLVCLAAATFSGHFIVSPRRIWARRFACFTQRTRSDLHEMDRVSSGAWSAFRYAFAGTSRGYRSGLRLDRELERFGLPCFGAVRITPVERGQVGSSV